MVVELDETNLPVKLYNTGNLLFIFSLGYSTIRYYYLGNKNLRHQME